MSVLEMPMNAANQHVAIAEEHTARGLIVLAAEEHHKASEALLAAIERSHDESAKRTLRMLYIRHCKDRDELRRRVQKLREEGKDPNLPQNPEPTVVQKSRQTANTFSTNVTINHNSASSLPHKPMMDSQNTVDESFMVLGGQRSDPGDAFNQFWNVMQGMLDNLSQPVAFATAPLGDLDVPTRAATGPLTPNLGRRTGGRDGSLSSDTDADEPMLSKFTRRIGISRESSKNNLSAKPPGRYNGVSASSSMDEDFDDGEFFEDDDELSGSFYVIPSGPEPSSAALKRENIKLKDEISAAQEKVRVTEHILRVRKDQDMHLRESIFQAQKAMSASGMLPRQATTDPNHLNLSKSPMPIPSLSTGREAQYARRIIELEEDLRALRAENEKNKLMIIKFRDRWEKLKESAKRKKEAKVAAESITAGIRDRIVEEPEAEEELDGTSG